MKITMYELLGLVKVDKAPKKIKYKDKIYHYNKGYDFNYMYNSSDYSPLDRDKSLFTFNSYKTKDGRRCWDDNTAINFLNDEVEILEEEKKIPEKLPLIANTGVNYPDDKFIERILNLFYEFNNKNRLKINEIIDYLEYLKNKGE